MSFRNFIKKNRSALLVAYNAIVVSGCIGYLFGIGATTFALLLLAFSVLVYGMIISAIYHKEKQLNEPRHS